MIGESLTCEEKIRRGRIELQDEEPFFAHILMNLKLKERNIPHPMGVDINGFLYYSPEVIKGEELDLDMIKGILVHESIHIAFKHLFRKGNLNERIWNFATDVVTNHIVKENGYKLPEGIITGKKLGIEDVEEKSAEEVYKELEDKAEEISCIVLGKKGKDSDGDKKKKRGKGKGKGKKRSGGGENGKKGDKWVRIDKHIGGKKEDRENKKKIKEWEEKIDEARKIAKRQGNLPLGVGRKIDNLLKPKIDWRTILYKYITRVIPYDYTWIRPSKSTLSKATEYYLPSIKRENVDVIATVDTSGSISKEELTKFVSEIRNIENSFNQVDITLLIGDYEIQEVYEKRFELDKVEWKGGGGTDHQIYYDWVKENKQDAKVIIHLTDAYTSFPDENEIPPNLDSIWVLTKNHKEKEEIPFGKKVVLR